MNAPLAPDWSSANQQLLVLEFARLKTQLQPGAHDGFSAVEANTARTLIAARQFLGEDSAIDWLCRNFDLSAFERDLLLLCAGVEMDAELARACAHAHGDTARPWASFGLALAALQAPHWSALSPHAPLRHWRLLEVDDSTGLTAGQLRIDERILHFLAGINDPDVRLLHLLRPAAPLPMQAKTHAQCTQAAIAALAVIGAPHNDPPLIALEGDDRPAAEDIASRAAASYGLQCQVLMATDIPAATEERAALRVLWQREARLLGCALLVVVDDAPGPAADTARALIEELGGMLFLSSPCALAIDAPLRSFRVDKPSAADSRDFWIESLGAGTTREHSDMLAAVASHFRVDSRSMQHIAESMRLAGEGPHAAATNPVWQRCRQSSRTGLDALAQRLSCAARWDELVLPDAQIGVLRQIAAHVRQRHTVLEQWGFAAQGGRGLGLATLFAGDSGTGKTLAAEVLANTLELDLYRIDLSAVVSKYIGETEKNLRKVFDAAEDCGAILLFDEADALFGKRTEVKDSHDRHANIEVSYLLQRMEAYRGLAILTTNLKSSLDKAFLRRLRFVVQFPFPDHAQRLALWQRAFPAATPTQALDLDKLASLSMAGGSIRNIAMNAAFLAADAGEAVGMHHILQAAHGEATKRERPLTEAETRGWT